LLCCACISDVRIEPGLQLVGPAGLLLLPDDVPSLLVLSSNAGVIPDRYLQPMAGTTLIPGYRTRPNNGRRCFLRRHPTRCTDSQRPFVLAHTSPHHHTSRAPHTGLAQTARRVRRRTRSREFSYHVASSSSTEDGPSEQPGTDTGL
jgi:hypothetical protein